MSSGGAGLLAEPWQPLQDVVQSPPASASWQSAQVTLDTVAGGLAAWHWKQMLAPWVTARPWKPALPFVIQSAG